MQALDFARPRHTTYLSELIQFLSIPSISTQPKYGPQMIEAANWLRDQLSAAGFPRVEIMPTPGHPIVYAEWLPAGPAAPTVLMGFGLPDDNLHAPNEKMHLPNLYRGIETVIRFFEYMR